LANDVPEAYKIIELQEKLNIPQSWELTRDKSNFLRYLNRHEEAYRVASEISDERTKNLALSWFEHKFGNTKYAFELTEQARKDVYWWKFDPPYNYKLWNGENVETLVVRAESGFGDQIIFARWISYLKKYCKNLYYDGNGLEKIFIKNFNILDFKTICCTSNIYVVPIMSLAYHLKIENPEQLIYIKPDNDISNFYKERYPKKTSLRIGLCVQGEKTHVETTLRTLPLKLVVDELIKLGEIINLQKEIDKIDNRINYIKFDTWDETFALINECDIIVTCDTSIAHAASSMGKVTIVLMHAAAYFTWNHNSDLSKSLWYKNTWCIHQDVPCKWEGSIYKCSELIKKIKNEIFK
jgi:hypothetical protein